MPAGVVADHCAANGRSLLRAGNKRRFGLDPLLDLTGEPFKKYMQDKVVRSLGRNSSTFCQSLTESFKNRAATGYPGLLGDRGGERSRPHPALAVGGLWSSAADVARLLIAVQKAYAGADSSILSQKLAHEMLSKQSDDYRLGFFRGGTTLRFGHNGENRGFSAISVAFADTRQGIVFLMNASTDIQRLKNILIEATGEEYQNIAPRRFSSRRREWKKIEAAG